MQSFFDQLGGYSFKQDERLRYDCAPEPCFQNPRMPHIPGDSASQQTKISGFQKTNQSQFTFKQCYETGLSGFRFGVDVGAPETRQWRRFIFFPPAPPSAALDDPFPAFDGLMPVLALCAGEKRLVFQRPKPVLSQIGAENRSNRFELAEGAEFQILGKIRVQTFQ